MICHPSVVAKLEGTLTGNIPCQKDNFLRFEGTDAGAIHQEAGPVYTGISIPPALSTPLEVADLKTWRPAAWWPSPRRS